MLKTATRPVRVAILGCGWMSLVHLDRMLRQQDTTAIQVVSDPSDEAYNTFADHFTRLGLQPPPNEKDLDRLVHAYQNQLDAVFIITPHVLHYQQTLACLEAGLDVLLEKPMVVSAEEAVGLMRACDRTGRLLVVAFQGSLSPQVRTASRMLRSGELGELLNIAGITWQNWKDEKRGTWRMDPVLAGGGFLFDTGAHLLNTTADLAGEDFSEIAAWMDNRGTEVDIRAVVMGRLKSGALVTLNACGDTIPSCSSDIRVYCTGGILRTDMWGDTLELQRPGEKKLKPVKVPDSLGVWQQFLLVREGQIKNPCPPEVGLRMARLWDAILESSARGGQMVHLS